MKKILPLLLVLTLCLSMLPTTVLAAGDSIIAGGGDVVNLGENLSFEEGESYGFTVSPHHLDFGSCFVGDKVEPLYVTLTNTGDTNIDDIFSGFFVDHDEQSHYGFVSKVIVAGELNAYEELEPGKSLTYEVRLNPWKEGSGTISYEGQFLLNSGVNYGYDVNTGALGVGKTGRYGKIPGVLTVDYDVRPLSEVGGGDIDWDVEVGSIDFGVVDTSYYTPLYDSISKTYINILGEHRSQEKTFTVTNRGSHPFDLEAEVDNSKCDRDESIFYAHTYDSYNVKPGESATVRVSTMSGRVDPGTVEGCELKLTAYYPDSKEKNSITTSIPLSVKYLYDGGYVVEDVSDRQHGRVTVSGGVDRSPYYDNRLFTVEEGCDAIFTVSPNDPAAYHVSDIKLNGVSVGISDLDGDLYILHNIQENYTFEAIFAPGPAPATPPKQPASGSDQPAGWAKPFVDRAIAEGILPAELQRAYGQPITRREFCVLADALYTKVNGTAATADASFTFTDTADPAVLRMASIKVVNGVGNNKFDPNDKLTREQAATILSRLTAALGKPLADSAPTFTDSGAISSWAVAAVGQMEKSGIMNGVGDNMFSPAEPYTREQSVITVIRILDLTK